MHPHIKPPRQRVTRRAVQSTKPDLSPLSWASWTRRFFAHAAAHPFGFRCRHVGCDLARSSTVFHRLAALGGALPYGTLSPCWCVKYTQNRTSFHDAHATSGTDGVDPASGGRTVTSSPSAPRHIKPPGYNTRQRLSADFLPGGFFKNYNFVSAAFRFS